MAYQLTWDDVNGTEEGHRVYRSLTPMHVNDLPTPLATLPPNTESYLDATALIGVPYFYRVAAFRGNQVAVSSEIAVGSAGDPHWDKVVALLHFDGDLSDAAGTATWTFAGNADTSGAPMFGTGALKCNTGWIYSTVGVPLPADFTIELFSYQPALKQVFVFDFRPYGVNGYYPNLFTGNGGELYFFINSASVITAPAGTVVAGVYKHIAVSRSGGVIRLFYDGNLIGSTAISDPMGSGPIAIGAGHQPNRVNHNGYIDEFRITDGVARYTENFTPPTEPFPNY